LRDFYEDYERKRHGEARQRDSPAMIRRSGFTAVKSFFTKLFTAVLYIVITALSGAGLTALLYKPIRDMLFELVQNTFFGG
jgi:hypothetical protein